MTPLRFPALAALALALSLEVLGEPSPRHVVSVPPSPETPASARIAPNSDVPASLARLLAVQVGSMVAGTEIFTVAPSGSMRPAFDDNTVLLTEPAPFEKLQVGDIIVFRHSSSGMRVVHRILERRDGGFWTRGDRTKRMDDELVTRANYMSRVYGILYTSRSEKGTVPEGLRKTEAVLASAR